MTLFTGLLGYPITPANDEGVVDPSAIAKLADRLAQGGVDGIGILGSTGCALFLDRKQRERTVRAAVEGAAGRVPVTVGIGALRTDHAIRLAQDAAEAGAAGLLLQPVSYTPLTGGEVFEHFRAVAGATGLPLCIYENPATTGFRFDDELVRRIAQLPTVAAIKRPAPEGNDAGAGARDWVHHQRSLAGDGFSIGCSVDWHAPMALMAGADGWHSVLAGVLPELCSALMRSIAEKDDAGFASGMQRLEPVWSLFRAHSSLRVVHAMAALLGVADVRPPAPIRPLDAEPLAQVAALLDWLGV